MDVSFAKDDIVTKLPQEDIVFTHIFTYLDIVDLCIMRAVSRSWKQCVENFFAHMRTLNLTKYAQMCTAEAFRSITRNSSQLQTLVLRDCKDWITDEILTPVCQMNRRLVKVNFVNCSPNLQVSLHAMAVNNKEIEEVYLKDCHWVTTENVFLVAAHCPELRILDIAGCWEITDDCVGLLTKFSKKLKHLSLAKDYKLTDNSMKYIAANCKNIQKLNIRGCWRITDNGVRVVGDFCKKLDTLMVKECRDVTETSLARIRLKNIWVDKPKPMTRAAHRGPQLQD